MAAIEGEVLQLREQEKNERQPAEGDTASH